ncbi:homocitrate synthase/isopropylmalate synthase family protein [Mesorhizobium waimense]|uniref:homocitrate synthase/isopropylmalate synthase family protein n=1 Tax=Mesorhizobium waimense TaxID=1300307 RepID=UPI003CCACB22
MLKDPRTYQGLDPALVGRWRRIVIGKHSGATAIAHVLGESGRDLDPDLRWLPVSAARQPRSNRPSPQLNWSSSTIDCAARRLAEALHSTEADDVVFPRHPFRQDSSRGLRRKKPLRHRTTISDLGECNELFR